MAAMLTRRYNPATPFPESAAMSIRAAASYAFVALIALGTAGAPSAQQTVPQGQKPKKNPLLKLAQPWPEPAVLQARREEAEKRPLFQEIRAARVHPDRRFQVNQQGPQPRQRRQITPP